MKVAIIPARGGSKRIPRKNIRPFLGKPMIAHSIACARESGLFERVIVSTDDNEIAQIAVEHGAEVPFVRPRELSDDHTGTTAVMAHAVRFLQDSGVHLSAVCCIYAVAPFMRVADLRTALSVLMSGGWTFVFPATTFASSVYRSFHVDAGGELQMLFPEFYLTRSQDLREALHDAGQFYWGKPDAWLTQAKDFDRDSTVILLPRWRVHDIDTEDDWRRAELIAGSLKSLNHDGGSEHEQ